jgi:hypothetical protein
MPWHGAVLLIEEVAEKLPQGLKPPRKHSPYVMPKGMTQEAIHGLLKIYTLGIDCARAVRKEGCPGGMDAV